MKKPSLLCLCLFLFVSACSACAMRLTPDSLCIEAREVVSLALPKELREGDLEFSGMAWYDEQLVLLPQYPKRANNNLLSIGKKDILAHLDGKGGELPFTMIRFDDGGISDIIEGFEGFEALVFDGESVWLTIESHNDAGMLGWLVRGQVLGDLEAIVLDGSKMQPLASQSLIKNASDEALVLWQGRPCSFYEDNGLNVNGNPVAHCFDAQSGVMIQMPFPRIEYRVTDACELDANGHFWVLNYFYPGDKHLETADDLLTKSFMTCEQDAKGRVERIVPLRVTDSGFALGEESPIYLRLLANGKSPNWEGLAALDELGFLVITDTHPETIFGFVGY